jgi:tRNA (guanine-N7-)-methyltransferase
MSENQPVRRTIKSFVRREGRMTRAQKLALQQLLPVYGLQITQGFWDFSAIFEHPGSLILEIGFGMGDSLLEMAQKFPDTYFLGVEVYRLGIGALLNRIHQNRLKNVRVIVGDAVDILTQNIPDSCLDCVQIFFPDPWPKRKHHKRRLIQEGFIRLVQKKLKIKGLLHIRTDNGDYANSILKEINCIRGMTVTKTVYESSMTCSTKFEKRGLHLGCKIYDLQGYSNFCF